jgi:hypothetical protein
VLAAAKRCYPLIRCRQMSATRASCSRWASTTSRSTPAPSSVISSSGRSCSTQLAARCVCVRASTRVGLWPKPANCAFCLLVHGAVHHRGLLPRRHRREPLLVSVHPLSLWRRSIARVERHREQAAAGAAVHAERHDADVEVRSEAVSVPPTRLSCLASCPRLSRGLFVVEPG